MAKKIISSKETYFKRPNNTLTLAEWEAYKLANPKPEYTGEICWQAHDIMITRGKPALDSLAIIKEQLKELHIDYVIVNEQLKITSDLTGQVVIVLDIENDDLIFQLENAGAVVVYLTSNPNFNRQTPDLYFSMYADTTDSTDYPATDKRNLFNSSKNIIVKYINFFNYKSDLFELLLYNIIRQVKETYNMIPNKVLMNPPYCGDLHLNILSTVTKVTQTINPAVEISSVQPVYWLEDPLSQYKQGTAFKKFKRSIYNKLSALKLINADIASYKFGIELSCDLGIYTITQTPAEIKLFSLDIATLIDKIRAKTITTLKDKLEQGKLKGTRVEIHEMLPAATGAKGGQSFAARTNCIAVVNLRNNAVFTDGFNTDGIFWTDDGRAKNGSSKSTGAPFPYSIQFTSDTEANNFVESCRTEFYKNLVHLVKFNAHTPFAVLPYMEDYSKVWTDEDYCKFFDLTEEESKFMCRTVDDYRVKDFINYINLDKE